MSDLEIPYDHYPTVVRMAIQKTRNVYHGKAMLEHGIILKPSTLADDIYRGIDGTTRLVGSHLDTEEPMTDKERFFNYETKERYMDATYEMIRDLNLPVGSPGYWGREWRNRGEDILYYDLTTQDEMRRRFWMADLNNIAISVDTWLRRKGAGFADEAYRGGFSTYWDEMGWMLKTHTDASSGHEKSTLYLRWLGSRRAIRHIDEWDVSEVSEL